MKKWVRMPSYWVRADEAQPLANMRWSGQSKSDQIAALMTYIVLVHHANDAVTADFPDVGYCRLTYDRLSEITGLSRAKVSGGLRILEALELIESKCVGRSNTYRVLNFGNRSGWAKLPAKDLYTKDMRRIPAFHGFKLRSKVELNALKMYFLVLSLRSNEQNFAMVSYDKINLYTGIARNDVKSAISFLVTHGLIQVEQQASDINEFSTANKYRPCFIEPYKHMGTTGRLAAEFD